LSIFAFVSPPIGTKKGRISITEAPFRWGATAVCGGGCPKLPPLDPPLLLTTYEEGLQRALDRLYTTFTQAVMKISTKMQWCRD